MIRKLAVGAAAASISVFALAGTADAKPPTGSTGNGNGYCVQAGLGTLKSLGLLQAAAQKQVDYAPFGSQEGGAGLIRIEFDGPAFLSLGQVVSLHTSSPELFAWCD